MSVPTAALPGAMNARHTVTAVGEDTVCELTAAHVALLQVKENFERFISCKTTIDDIHIRLRKAEGDGADGANGASTADMGTALVEVSTPQL